MKTIEQSVKNEILNTIAELAEFNPLYRKLNNVINHYGAESIEVNNWFVQFSDCQSAMDFILAYEC